MIIAAQFKANYKPIRKMSTGKYIIMVKLEDIDDTSCLVCQGLFDNPSVEQIKKNVFSIINEQTTQRIVETFEWNGKAVWLSETNQHNYKAAYDLAVQTKGLNLPYKIKVGEEDSPEYIEFATVSEFKDFFLAMNEHINKCIEEGWAKKDAVDWAEYENGLKAIYGE